MLLILDVADSYIKISTGLVQLSTIDNSDLAKFLTKVAETFEKARVSVGCECSRHLILFFV
jgi:sorting nexin-5/6/32